MKKWNKETNKWELLQQADRVYPELPSSLCNQLEQIQKSTDGMMQYWPAQAAMKDGSIHERVYFADAEEYIRVWGVWPSDDSGKQEIKIGDVASILTCPSRLPHKFADQLYRAGESGMGYVVFELQYVDGLKTAHLAGNAVDFVQLPEGKRTEDIVNVTPHAGREYKKHLNAPEYAWCLFRQLT